MSDGVRRAIEVAAQELKADDLPKPKSRKI